MTTVKKHWARGIGALQNTSGLIHVELWPLGMHITLSIRLYLFIYLHTLGFSLSFITKHHKLCDMMNVLHLLQMHCNTTVFLCLERHSIKYPKHTVPVKSWDTPTHSRVFLYLYYFLHCRIIVKTSKLWNNTYGIEILQSSHPLPWWLPCTLLAFSQPASWGSHLECISNNRCAFLKVNLWNVFPS